MSSKRMQIGFIGLGLMGNPMAKNILKKGFSLSVYNRSSEKTKELQKLGATVVKTPMELGETCDVVITCVTGPKDVREVLLGKNGVALADRQELIVVDMSTIGPTAACRIADDLKEMKIDFVDAPVTGGTSGAEKGTLTIFIGGKPAIYEKVKPVLETMGTDLQYIGKVGMGQGVKLINNLIVGETITALAEGFLLADQMKIPRKKMADALQNVFGLSPNMKNKMPNMVAGKHPVTFSVANIRKDLHLAQLELENKNKLPQLKVAEKLYKQGIDQQMSNEDLSAVIEVLEEK
jgi:3-hydroxyisobutyrate dehydrogenase-like beta-hydroxyacid dehydrogenase